MSDLTQTKKCTKCGLSKFVHIHFTKDVHQKDGLNKWCRACHALRRREYITARTPRAGDQVLTDVEILANQALAGVDIDLDELFSPAPTTALETAYQKRSEERAKRDLKKEHTALLDENERLKTNIAELVKMQRPPDILVYQKAASERSDAVACAIASDWHVEEPVKKEDVHGLNEYNLDIAKSRAEHFFKNFLRLTDISARDSKVNTMYLAALGDFFSGFIHEELLSNTLLAPGDAAHFVKGLFVSGIDFLLRESSYRIEGDWIPGNHGRMTDKMWFGDPTGTSLETFMYHAIVDRYEGNPRVAFRVADRAMVYRKFYENFVMRQIHGYEVKYGGGVGGLTIPLRKALAQWNNPIRANLTILGHFHQRLDGGDFMANGSLIGYNTFAQAIKASYEEAVQSFFQISARGGGEKSIVAPIWLDSKHKESLVAA